MSKAAQTCGYSVVWRNRNDISIGGITLVLNHFRVFLFRIDWLLVVKKGKIATAVS